MSAKKEYLLSVFAEIQQSPKLIDATLIFYHAEVPVEQAREYVRVLATKLEKAKQ